MRISRRAALGERLKLQLEKTRCALFGQSSERGKQIVEQLELAIADLEETQAEVEAKAVIEAVTMPSRAPSSSGTRKPARRPLPDHLPRERIVYPSPCVCGEGGGTRLRMLGEIVTESLECEPRRWKVVEHVRETRIRASVRQSCAGTRGLKMREERKTGGKIQGRRNANQTPKGRPMEKNVKDIGVSFDALVHELLGLDPSALGKLSPAEDTVNGASCAGLGTFMRRTLQRSLTLVGQQEATLRLHTDVSANSHGWPDRKTADLHELFVWALIREPRRFHSRSFVPLLAADHKLVELPQKPDGCFSSLSTIDLVAEAQWRLDVVIDWMRDATHTANPVSIRALIRRKLGISPETLMTHYYTLRDHAEARLRLRS